MDGVRGGGGYGMVWWALRYREWLAGRSLTLPVFRAGVRGQQAVTLGCCTPGSGGGGGCSCAIPGGRAGPPAACAAAVPVVPVPCVPVPTKPKVTRTGRAGGGGGLSTGSEFWLALKVRKEILGPKLTSAEGRPSKFWVGQRRRRKNVPVRGGGGGGGLPPPQDPVPLLSC